MTAPPQQPSPLQFLAHLRRLIALIALFGAVAHAVPLNLTFSGGVAPGGGACTVTTGSICRYTNVVQGATGTQQRDATIQFVGSTSGSTLTGAFDNDALTYTDAAGNLLAGVHPEVFAPTVVAPATLNALSTAQFRVTFYTPGGSFSTVNALAGSIFITSLDTDGDNSTLREFVQYNSAVGGGLAASTLLVQTSALPTLAFRTGVATSVGTGITTDSRFKASARYDNPATIDFFAGAVTGATACAGVACQRLGAYSFVVADSVFTPAVLDVYKTVRLTTDQNSNGQVNTNDVLTYTVTVVNAGSVSATGVQVTDALPAGLAITATGAQTVRLGGTVNAAARNTGYTGAGVNDLLSATQTIAPGSTISIDIPVRVTASGSSGTLNNQASVTGTNFTTLLSDNLDASGAATLPSSVTSATGWPGASGTITQSQNGGVSATSVNYVGTNNAPLTCTNTLYALLTDGVTNSFRRIAPLNPNGTVGTTVATVPTQFTNTNAALGINSAGTRIFVATDVGTLEVYDVISGTWVASVAVPSYTSSIDGRIVRMTITPSDVGYFSVGGKLWSFQTIAPYTINSPVNLAYTDSSGLTPVPTIVGSGDFFASADGSLYLSVNNGTAGSFLDTFKVRPDGSTIFLGRLNDTDIGTDTYGGYGAVGSSIYGSSSNGRIILADLANLTVTQTAPTDATRGSTDLASCSYPSLAPVVTATKTASVVAKGSGNTGSGAQIGDTLEYTIIVRNSGNIAAPSTTFSDSIPTGTTYVAGSTTLNSAPVADASGVMPYAVSGGSFINSPNESRGTLRADTTPADTTDREATIRFRVTIGSGVSQVTNQATVTYVDGPGPILTDGDSVTPGNQITTTLLDIADLAIDKSGPGAVGSGGTVTYTIRVWNNGPRSVTGASVTDSLPANFTVTALTCAPTGTATCGTESFTASSVSIVTGALSLDTNTANATPDGNFLTYTLTGTAPANGTLSNTAAVSSTTVSESASANNTSAVVTRVVDAVNDTGAVTFGQGTTFNILGNDTVGGAPATTTNATLPVIVNNGGLTGLSVNASGQLVLAASLLNVPGTYTVTYRICDATLTTACDNATIAITVTPAAADLGIVKSQRLGTTGTFQTTALSVTQGSTVQYQIVVTNSGPSAVTNATFTDAVPANLTGLSVVSAAGTGTTCTATFTGSTLNGSFSGSTGQTCTVTIQGTATTTGTFTNTATVTAPSGITDATTGNNTSSVNTTVTPAADLAINKSGPVAVGSGGTVTYTIRVWNNGPSSVTGASVTDTLPAGFTVTGLSCAATGTATCGTQSFTASSVSIVTGTLSLDTNTANATPDGNFLTYTLTGTASASGTLSNTASVTVPAGITDLTPDNNTSAAVVTRVVDAVNDPAVNFGFGVGGNVTVLGNDTVGGAVATTTNATVTIQNNGGITGLTVNGSGQLVVPAGTPAGTYTVTYQICDATVTTACDTATVQVTVDAPLPIDLAVSKTGPAFAQPGGTVTYTIRAWNNGPTVSSATVTDTVPADLTGVSWTCAGTGGATCSAASGSGNAISVGATLPVDTGVATTADTAFVTVTVTATAPSAATLESTPAARTITNTASVSGPNGDPTPANNSASAVTNMVYGKLTKEVRNVTKNTAFGTSGGGLPLEVLEYCIAFQNLGGAALPNFVLVDHVPGNTNALITAYDEDEPSAATGFGVKLTRGAVTSYLSSSAADADGGSLTTTGGTFARGTMTVTLGTLAVGESGRACFQTTIR